MKPSRDRQLMDRVLLLWSIVQSFTIGHRHIYGSEIWNSYEYEKAKNLHDMNPFPEDDWDLVLLHLKS
jgi:hypothetical protein